MDYSLPGSSLHGISQARILEWFVISFSGGSSQARGQTHMSYTGRRILYHRATREAHVLLLVCYNIHCNLLSFNLLTSFFNIDLFIQHISFPYKYCVSFGLSHIKSLI